MAIETDKQDVDCTVENLFKDVTYYIVGDIEQKILDLLNNGGAKRDSYLSQMVSLVIADDHTQDEYSEAKELFDLPVVTSQWVLLSVKCKKKLNIDLFVPEGQLFSGVVACASKLDEDDNKSLWGMITYNGGQCRQILDQSCTHLLTNTTEGEKYEAAMKHEIKIVTPDWVVDCIKAGSVQDEEIYHPTLIEYPKPRSPTPPPLPPREPSPIPSYENMDVTMPDLLTRPQGPHSNYLGIPTHPMAGGRSTKPRSPGNQVICSEQVPLERQGSFDETGGLSRPTTPSAKQALARMVNNRIQAGGQPRNSLSPRSPGKPPYPAMPHQVQPHTQMQHPGLPGPPPLAGPPSQMPPGMQGLPPFPTQESQGNQSQRTLRNITNNGSPGAGPSVRPNTNKINQILGLNMKVPPRHPPPRYGSTPQKGPAHSPLMPTYWGHDPTDNVPLDMCLLGCVFYVTDYQKTVGQEQIQHWKAVIEQHGGQVDSAYSNRVTHLLCANQHSDVFHLGLKDQRRVVTAYWLNDVLTKRKMLPPWQALHVPLIFNTKPCSDQIICVTNFEGEERTRIKQMITAIGAKYTGYMTHSNSVLVCKKPEGTKYEKAKDWHIPVVNSLWLSDLILGHLDALRLPLLPKYLPTGQGDPFYFDINRIVHLLVGWRNPLKIPKEVWKRFLPGQPKTRPSPAVGQENVAIRPGVTDAPPAKRPRLEKPEVDRDPSILNRPGPRVLFTGFPRGIAKRLQAMALQLGGNVTENPAFCTHLVTPTFSRTMKFFVAINVCKHVVTRQWIDDSVAQNQFIDETNYALRDLASEREMQCSLQESLKRAHAKPLFQGLTFFITPSVYPPESDLIKIVESAGGKIIKRRPSARTLSTMVDDQGNPKFVVISCENDLHICRDLLAKSITLYNAELILTGVMRQVLDFNMFQLV